MQKESIIAILIGFGIGFIVALGIFYFPRKNVSLSQSKISPLISETKNSTQTQEQLLKITVPEDNQIVRDNHVIVRGKTKSSSIVTITTFDKDYLTQASPNGDFEQDIALSAGPNEIVTTAFFVNPNDTSIHSDYEIVKRHIISPVADTTTSQ